MIFLINSHPVEYLYIMITSFKNRYLLTSLLLISISACDAQSDEVFEAKTTANKVSQTELKHSPLEDMEGIESEDIVEENNIKAISVDKNKADCNTVRDMMLQVSNTSKIEAIYQVNEALPACLEQAGSTTALMLLKEYDEMYDRFLNDGMQSEDEIDVFYDIAYKLDSGKTIPKSDYAKLNPHLKYLLTLSQGDEDVHLQYLGEGYYTFNHDLSASNGVSVYLLSS